MAYLMYNKFHGQVEDYFEPCYREVAKVSRGYTIVKDITSRRYLETLGFVFLKEVDPNTDIDQVAAQSRRRAVKFEDECSVS